MTAPSVERTVAEPSASREVLIAGFSTRAAAQSARRAGFHVAACDAFLDRDLAAVCDETALLADLQELSTVAERFSPRCWLFTGGVENHPAVVAAVSSRHRLLGCGAEVLEQVRDPFALQRFAAENALLFPTTRSLDAARAAELPLTGRYLLKPFRSGGGRGIILVDHLATGAASGSARTHYVQQLLSGTTLGASFLAVDGACRLLGICRQLPNVAHDFARNDDPAAAKFRYAGSVGPVEPAEAVRREIVRCGERLASHFRLRGLFGIDVLVDATERVWLLEVNPRYTASMELLERAGSESVVGLHASAIESGVMPEFETAFSGTTGMKRIVYYDGVSPLCVSAGFSDRLFAASQVGGYPSVGDVPRVGTIVSPGDPLCTVFSEGVDAESAAAASAEELLRRLRETSCGS